MLIVLGAFILQSDQVEGPDRCFIRCPVQATATTPGASCRDRHTVTTRRLDLSLDPGERSGENRSV